MESLCVHELFVSLQGETTWSGIPCFFIRLAGCNLRCSYCDTPEAQHPERGIAMRIDQVVQACRDQSTPLITVTGGEPLMQAACPILVGELLTLPDRTVMVETNGTFDRRMLPPEAIAVVDIKCPGSGVAQTRLDTMACNLAPHDEIKFVLCDRADYEFALEMIRTYHLATDGRRILFSPVTDRLPPRRLADWLIADRPAVRLQLQLHRRLTLR